MATHDYILANASGAAFRTDLNNALAAIVSNNSNSSEPATMYAYQWWADTTNAVMKIRNSSNNAWIELFQLDGTLTLEDGSASTPALAFRDDLNTGIFSSAADTFDIATAGAAKFRVDSSGNVQVSVGQFTVGTTASSGLQFINTGTFGTLDSANLTFRTNSATRMTLDTSGNVGLGVTSISDARFRIKGANNSTGAYNDGLMVTSNNETVFKKYSWAGIETDGGMKFAERVDSSTLLTTMQISTTGNVTITGSLSKGSGSFKIDHPLPEKTDTHNLVHSFVEGPQADNIYRGKVDLVSGTATVNIDKVSGMSEGTFVLLNRDIQCFTSNETGWTAVKGSVSENILTITVEDNTCTDTISWLVIGERQDSHMKKSNLTDENGKIIVEPLKEEED